MSVSSISGQCCIVCLISSQSCVICFPIYPCIICSVSCQSFVTVFKFHCWCCFRTSYTSVPPLQRCHLATQKFLINLLAATSASVPAVLKMANRARQLALTCKSSAKTPMTMAVRRKVIRIVLRKNFLLLSTTAMCQCWTATEVHRSGMIVLKVSKVLCPAHRRRQAGLRK